MTTTASSITLPKPNVIIDRMALEKIKYFVAKDSLECSGMGITRVVGDTIFVDDVQMLEQRNGMAHTDIDEAAVGKLMNEWKARDGNINFWWHSHVNMSVFWSSTDLATIRQLGQHGMCVASVFNKKGEIRTAVCCQMTVPFATGPQVAMFDELPLHVQYEVPAAIKELWDKEHADNVKRTPMWSVGGYQNYGHNQHNRQMGFHSGDHGFHDPYGTDDFGRVGGRNNRGDTLTFRPITTIQPDFWDNYKQAQDYDIDWMEGCNSETDPEDRLAPNRWRKSQKYITAYKEWAERVSNPRSNSTPAVSGVPAVRGPRLSDAEITTKPGALSAAEVDVREQFAEKRAEILAFWPGLDLFELFTGAKVSASWYMSKALDAVTYRQRAANEHEDIAAAKVLASAAGDPELDREIAEYEQDLRDHAEDVPNPNMMSEQDVEDLCKRSFAI